SISNGLAQMIDLSAIRTDDVCQARVAIRPAVVREYAQAMKEQLAEGSLRFPPVVLFTEGTTYWVGDGYHRVLAARSLELKEILAEVHPGTQREALLYAISANAAHGLARTNADKRRAVTLLLNDAEWGQWSDREIARRWGVSRRFVDSRRKGASGHDAQMGGRKVRRGGRVYEIAVSGSQTQTTAEESAPMQPRAAAVIKDGLGLAVPEARLPAFAAAAAFE